MSNPPTGFPPQPGQPVPPQGPPVSFDFNKVDINAIKKFSPLQLVVAGSGILTFIFGFFPYYTVSLWGYTESTTAWDAWASLFGVLLALAGSAVAAGSLFGAVSGLDSKLSHLLPAVGLGGGFVLILISWFYYPGASGFQEYIGRGFGFYAALILSAAGAAVAVFNFLGSKGQVKPIAGFAPTGYGPVNPGYPQPGFPPAAPPQPGAPGSPWGPPPPAPPTTPPTA